MTERVSDERLEQLASVDNDVVVNWGEITPDEHLAICTELFHLRKSQPLITEEENGQCITDCRTEEGITVGLIDSIITICRVLVHRKWNIDYTPMAHAIQDLRSDKDVQMIVCPPDEFDRLREQMHEDVTYLKSRDVTDEEMGELPPLGEGYRSDLVTTITEQQRQKWRTQWAKMDEDDCERHHYKHYEWECRKTFEELERRECQLREAMARVRQVEKERDVLRLSLAQEGAGTLFGTQLTEAIQRAEKAEVELSSLKNERLQGEPKETNYERARRENTKEMACHCGQQKIPIPFDGVNWYWQYHGRKGCTLELPDTVCWCGLKRSEHIDGHKESSASPKEKERQ